MNEISDKELTDIPLDERHTVVERINKKDLKPLYDTNHQHVYEKDPADEENGYYAEVCTVTGCNLGRLIAKV